MDIEIIPYSEEYRKHFTELNVRWVEKYFVLEPLDIEILNNPKEHIIDKGGSIYFAKMGDTIAGTFALISLGAGVFELSKMTVDEAFRGKKIANKMLEFCLTEAKKLNMSKIILYSNTTLQPAIHLYKKFGFKEIPLGNSEYTRSDIKMEIDIP
ncbi:MAG: GNAT family N-acetyltransferase [Ginsengibacter sp.]